MRVEFAFEALRQTKWYEYCLRFLLGAAVSGIAGIIAEKFGPEVGGLFLAFPAIFPASATLIEKHEKQKKENAGYNAGVRGRGAAALDAAGSAIGSLGLIAFATAAWILLPRHATWIALLLGSVLWSAVALSMWAVSRYWRAHRRRT
jgi:hypothetical protein